jgi:hypothetical protein
MKKDMIKKNVGDHVLLVPQAQRLDKHGFVLAAVRKPLISGGLKTVDG